MHSIAVAEYIKFYVGLFAIVNPLGLLPIFISLTSYQSPRESLKTNLTANFAVVMILSISIFAGAEILSAFSISIASFRIAGGSLIVLVAWSMLQGKLGEVRANPEESRELAARDSVAIVPLALPLMAGPGAISSAIVYASQYKEWSNLIGLSVVVALFAITSFLIFSIAPLVYRMMGKTGINVVTRIMGLIMMSLGIEIVAAGFKQLFPILS